ncbi:MAG TPA: hypothetical protein VK810_03555 [Dongiaceae bacterium]|jgi:hypothetical protein|nr:hypothetical protein [Dongiaceae bacterium]
MLFINSVFNYAERFKAAGLSSKDSSEQLELWHPDREVGTKPKKIIWVVYFAKSGGVEHHAESLELAQKWVEEKLEAGGRSFRDADMFKIKKIVYWN